MAKINRRDKLSAGNIPTPLSAFIGREREIEEIKRMVLAYRLVTLTGAGGSGKTRLSIRVAEELTGEFEDGIWFIELASIFDPELIPQTIASTLNIRPAAGKLVLDILIDHLSPQQTLLIFDNCEHLVSASAALIETLLENCPDLKILATSREVLGLTGEVSWLVPPLSLPEPQPWRHPSRVPDSLKLYEASESVQLFVDRAAAHIPGFQVTAENGAWVAEICRRLDGMPLAIELAAARVRSLSVQQIAQRLDDRFRLLTGGSRTASPRQQTLLSTLDWSYGLLSEKEAKVFQRFSVFSGSATLEAAEAICIGDGVEMVEVLDLLSQLVEKSLAVTIQSSGETRYTLLETIRQYANEKLSESGDAEEIRDRHLHYFLGWAENAESHLRGVDQILWLDRYEAEKDNLRAALSWSQLDPKHAEAGLRLAVACAPYWMFRGYLSEGRAEFAAVLRQVGANMRTPARAHALIQFANFAFVQSDYPAMLPLAEEALSIWREVGETGKQGLAFTLGRLGDMSAEIGDYEKATAYLQEALGLYRELSDPHSVSFILLLSGWTLMRKGDLQEAEKPLEEALELSQASSDQRNLAYSFSSLGELAIRRGHYERALSLLQEGLSLSRQMGDRLIMGSVLGSLGWAALRQGDLREMRSNLRESLEIRLDIGDKGGIAWCLEKLAEAAFLESQYQTSVKSFGAAAALRAPLGSVMDQADQPEYQRILSGLRSALGEDAFAVLWAEGAVLPLRQVIDLALSEPQPSIAAPTEKERFGGLTAREREVAVLISQGKSNREIAEAMTVGVKTIETYVTRILNKLGFDSRVQIATWVMEKDLR